MGNNPSQAMAAAAAKQQFNSVLGDTNKASSDVEKKAAEEAARKKAEIEQRNKDSQTAYDQKKQERQASKKKLSDAWAANRKANIK